MSFGVIVLIIAVVLLLYYLYITYIQVNPAAGNTKYDLNTSNTAIAYKTLKNATSTRFSYSVWIYVNSWSNTNTKKIISRGQDFELSLATTTPSLTCKLEPSSQMNLSNADKTITITNNFPLQKWTYVVVSVDNQIVDIYLDGKLVLSKKLTYQPRVVAETDITIGDTQTNDIFLTTILYTGNPMDPQTAWNTYLKGNGMNSAYNVNMRLSVLQNNIEQGKVSLF